MKNTLPEDHAWMVLNALPGIGPIAIKRLMQTFGDNPARILNLDKKLLKQVDGIGDTLASVITNWQDHFDLDKVLEKLALFEGRFINNQSKDYPPLLKEIYDPPIGLYCLGNFISGLKTIAIVGSRHCTIYGQKIAKQFASDLAQRGFCIVSGMARGIDSAAHEGALDAGGNTVAILGCGPDIIYPPENKALYEKIKATGAILTESSFGKKADKTTFPRRNRIISGMSQAIVVIETNSNGGSMITARLAGEQGRPVFAVPGPIDRPSSRGCHELIRDGVSLCINVDNILEELNYLNQLELPLEKSSPQKPLPLNLDDIEKEILTELQARSSATPDILATTIHKPIQQISSALIMLELKKFVVKRADGNFEPI